MSASALASPRNRPPLGAPHPLDFFGELVWIDRRPLLDTIELNRRRILVDVLWTFGDDGAPLYSMALCGRAKKNGKTSDLALAAIYRFLAWPSPAGNDAFLVANDEGQVADDLSLVNKLFTANPTLDRRLTVLAKEIVRKDGRGVLPSCPPATSPARTARRSSSLASMKSTGCAHAISSRPWRRTRRDHTC